MQSWVSLYWWCDIIKVYHLLRIWTDLISRLLFSFGGCAWVFDNFIFYLCHFSQELSHIHRFYFWICIFDIENKFIVVELALLISCFRRDGFWLHQACTKIRRHIFSILPRFHCWPILTPINNMQWSILRQEISVELLNCYFWHGSLWHWKQIVRIESTLLFKSFTWVISRLKKLK